MRCTARSKRTGKQCGQKACFDKSKCRWHGGLTPRKAVKLFKRIPYYSDFRRTSVGSEVISAAKSFSAATLRILRNSIKFNEQEILAYFEPLAKDGKFTESELFGFLELELKFHQAVFAYVSYYFQRRFSVRYESLEAIVKAVELLTDRILKEDENGKANVHELIKTKARYLYVSELGLMINRDYADPIFNVINDSTHRRRLNLIVQRIHELVAKEYSAVVQVGIYSSITPYVAEAHYLIARSVHLQFFSNSVIALFDFFREIHAEISAMRISEKQKRLLFRGMLNLGSRHFLQNQC